VSAEADLAAADYSQWSRNCDIVMKGGITSGVVYPHAVCELARDYRFRSVGGTSAGAIAAAATAAAEYGREKRGFNKLAELPDWLGRGANLRSLFQPQKKTRRLYAVLLAGVDRGPKGAIAAAVGEHLPAAVLGALPGLALAAVALVAAAETGSTALIVLAIAAAVLAGLPLALLGLALAVAGRVAWEANQRIPDNGFGLCSGAESDAPWGVDPLTPWLTKLLDGLAQTPDGKPLTFGHLWAGPDGDREKASEDESKRCLQLAMMTTNLVNRRAHQLPWDARTWFFKPEEMRELFPSEICDWMVERSPTEDKEFEDDKPSRRSRMRLALARRQGLYALPDPADLPVIVATRMSLSFPILLSAVPLWQFDMTREDNAVLNAWRQWAADRPGFDPLSPTGEWPRGERPATMPTAEPCWFSDGGISSNFPVHFFDRLLPRWPTFALNLRPFPFGQTRNPDDERENTWMVDSNRDGWKEWWYRFPDRPAQARRDGRLGAFLSSIVRTMQNRVDEAQMRVPGYRDRVAHVSMEKDEGGLNLTMPKPMIESLTARGRAAAGRLIEAYTPPDEAGRVITWDNHRWVRLRSSLSVFEDLHGGFVEGYEGEPLNGERTYLQLIERDGDDPPKSYCWTSANEREVAEAEIDGIAAAAAKGGLEGTVKKETPKPQPVGRIVPRD
jgi:predicted acylesterase/phospholipase RssA